MSARALALAGLLAFVPQLGAALSCLAPDIGRSYGEFHASPNTYVVLQGRLSRMGPAPPIRQGQGMEDATTPAFKTLFTGRRLGQTGPARARSLQVAPVCWASWCGQAQFDEDLLFFVRRDGDELIFEPDPCFGAAFPDTEENREILDLCMHSSSCPTLGAIPQ